MVHRDSTDDFLLLQISSGDWQSRVLQLSRNSLFLLSPRLCFFIVLNRDLFFSRDDSITSKRVIMRTVQPTQCLSPSETEGEVGHVKHVKPKIKVVGML